MTRFHINLNAFLKKMLCEIIIYLYESVISNEKRLIKIKRIHIILFLLFTTTLIIISSCTKPECKTSSDCASRACYLPKCENQKCVYGLQLNCCGNRINESIENGKQGNKCTCPQDYGKCEGKGKVKVKSKVQDASYLHYYCNEDKECVLGVEESDIIAQNVLDIINVRFFKASSIVNYNKPFDVGNDDFKIKITLDDISKDLVLPIELKNIRLLYHSEYTKSELVIGEKELDVSIEEVGEPVTISVPLNLEYKPKEIEEAGSIRYSIDYTYTKRIPSGRGDDGNVLYKEELVRERFNSPIKQVFFVRSG